MLPTNYSLLLPLGNRFTSFALLNRIVASRMKGMALENPFQGQEAAFNQAVFIDCFISILRTGRIKAAGLPLERREKLLIPFYYYQKYLFHFLSISFC